MTKLTKSQSQIEREIMTLLEAGLEDTRIPDAIAVYADKRASKPVTIKDAAALEAQLGVPVRISKRYGMTQVCWAMGTGQNPWLDERTLLIAHGDTGILWPHAVNLRLKNPAYFDARDERNARRRELLSDHRTLRSAIGDEVPELADESYVVRAAAAIVKMREAREALTKLIDHGKPMHVLRFEIEKLAGKE
jgi:hypothetical protein